MDIQAVLREYKQKFDVELALYLDKVIEEAQKQDTFVSGALEYIKTFSLSGGKRLRSTFMYYGYLASGGQEKERMLKVALSVELIHIFLLIHDDIIDRDALRHNVETVHVHYGKIGKKIFPKLEGDHFGNSIALIMGDMMYALGNQVLFDSPFDSALILKALSKLQSIVALTVIGQTKDVYIEYAKEATEEEILRMYEYKTARYTVEGPLQLGAIFGSGSDALLDGLSRYAIPIGIAFQIQDDILGIFGSEEKLGKPVGSDIVEGKWTLLVCHAVRSLAPGEKEEFLQLLQKGIALTREDRDRFRVLVRQSGALEYAQSMAKRYISEGRKAVLELEGIDNEAQEFLIGVADYMMQRDC
ncbi:MAG: polyprenyl synthetase family protein [Candidatus Moranbacteria bacterium]|nr:polyprenyl synthetase family protein [Candidatus Moranbacteria bacterium]